MARSSSIPKKTPAKRKSIWNKIKEVDLGNDSLSKKDTLLKLLKLLTAKTGPNKLFVGTNSVMKNLEKGQVSVVCVCRDTPRNLFDAISEACVLRKVPLVCIPGAASKELADALSLKRASCFSVPLLKLKESVITIDNNHPGEIENDTELDGIIDGIRDAALSMSISTSI